MSLGWGSVGWSNQITIEHQDGVLVASIQRVARVHSEESAVQAKHMQRCARVV